MTKIIAEIGWNHMGNLNLAKKMILSAKKNGADYVKTQIFDPSSLKPGPWDNDGRREIYKKAKLTNEKYSNLLRYSKKIKVNFFTSVMNIAGAKMVLRHQNNMIKIPSMENTNYELLSFCNKNFKKILISTGTAKFSEILKLKKIVSKKKINILHCTSSYPCVAENLNLPKIQLLKKYFKKVGFSDHSIGVYGSFIAMSYGVNFIEKHFTTNNKLPGRDNKFAILPNELNELSNFKKFFLDASKFKNKNFLKCEIDARKNYRGRWDLKL
jgi:N,N'-diacetyllegionaminate synthase